jgi:hypothetical protein|tara:strand:+ start:69 stop:581 length:513 start_codon:yes stop_codon:yes gene_type:complete
MTKIIIENSKCIATLFSCPTVEGLINKNQWTEIAHEENWADTVLIYNEDQTEEISVIYGELDLNKDFYSDKMKASIDKYFIIKQENWGGGNSFEVDGEDGIYEVTDLNFKPNTIRLGLIEDIINDNGEQLDISSASGLEYDYPEEYIKYYLIKDGKLIELEKDGDDFSEI